jgi:hypothetical protein
MPGHDSISHQGTGRRTRDGEPSTEPGATPRREGLAALHAAVGNRVVSDLLAAGGRAQGEPGTPVPVELQRSIDAARGTGARLPAALRGPMETVVDADLGNARIHTGPDVDRLTGALGARAFVQGDGVFVRSEVLSGDGAAATLAHELQHVADGPPATGSVMREADGQYEMSRGEVGELLNAQFSMQRHEAHAAYHESTGGVLHKVLTDVAPDPVTAPSWDFSLVLDNMPHSYNGQSIDQGFDTLSKLLADVRSDLAGYKNLHAEVLANRENHPVVGFISDKLGGVDPPSIQIWDEVETGPLTTAAKALSFSSQLAVSLAEPEAPKPIVDEPGGIDHGLPEGLDLSRFQTNPLTDLTPEAGQVRAAADKADASFQTAVHELQSASDDLLFRNRMIFYYKEGTERGAGHAVTGLRGAEYAGGVAATVATGGVAAEAGLGLWATAAVSGLSGGGYAALQNLAEQSGGMIFGDSDHIEWEKVAKVGVKGAVVGFVGGLAGGAMAGALKNALGRMITGLPAEAMEAYGLTANEILTNGQRLFVEWMGNTATSPVGTAVGAVMDRGLEGHWTVTSVDDFLDLCIRDMIVSGAMGGFFNFAAAHGGGAPDAPAAPHPEMPAAPVRSEAPAGGEAVPTPTREIPGPASAPSPKPTEVAPEPIADVREAPESAPVGPHNVVEIDMPLLMDARELRTFCQRLFGRQIPSLEGRATFHDSLDVYRQAFQRTWPGQEPPAGGFFDPNTNQLHVAPGQNLRIVVHEAVHAIAHERQPLGRQLLGDYLDEGITDMLTLDAIGPDPVDMSYQRNIEFARHLAARVGRPAVEGAILDGNYAGLRTAVRNLLGGETATHQFFTLLRQMGIGGDAGVEAHLRAMLDGAALVQTP